MRIISWNVNGLRAILKKGFTQTAQGFGAAVIMLQETKTHQPLPLLWPGWQEWWACGTRPGYSGTLVLVREELGARPLEVPEALAAEGRTVGGDFGDFYLINTYFPNGGQGPARLAYKMDFYEQYLAWIQELGRVKPVIFGGDVNTAHQEIDLARPKENATHTGFLPEERAWLDRVVAAGWVDVWRARHPGEIAYSWWDYKTRARERDVGWRIDYFFASRELVPRVADCWIAREVMGSDHAPVGLEVSESKRTS